MNKIWLLLGIFLFTSSCATNPGGYTNEQQISNRLVGMSKEEVVSSLGAPTQTAQAGGAESWTYIGYSGGLTGGECRITITLLKDRVANAVVNADDRSWVAAPLGSCKNLLKNFR